ncbi:MAG: hypothetical protein QOE11_3650 [Solirubrobacteraceae bacterium]|nr:hypothetical protein [Solirubrobacteraceae bacterium]
MTQRLPSLTSLRWFAALIVFGTHIFPLIEGSSLERGFHRIGEHGAVGVSFFFVLSGFVLAWTYRDGDSARAFYLRRFARIAPAYWAASILAFVVIAGVESDLTPSRVARAMFSFVALQSWIPDSRAYLGGNPVGWSLSDEMFFYALFPLIIVPAFRASRRSLLVAAAGCVLFTAVVAPLALAPGNASDGFRLWALKISPVVRISEFILGIALALLLRSGARLPRRRALTWCAVASSIAAYAAAGWAPTYLALGSLTLVPFSLLIVCFAQRDMDGETGWLHSPVLITLGLWSFCFYLVHQLVIRVIADVVTITGGPAVRLGYVALSLLFAIGISAAMYRVIEHPLERRLRGRSRRGGATQPAQPPVSAEVATSPG